MKCVGCSCLCAVLVGLTAGAQEIAERGPNHNLIKWTEEDDSSGERVAVEHSYTEIGSGLNYWSPELNSWTPSTDVIEFLRSGAVYRQGQYRLLFSANINDPNGNLEWFPSDDQRIVIQTIGIAVTEQESGDSVWIGQLKNAQGFLTAQNEITWPSCFDQIDASVRVKVRPWGFENDVVLHERVPDVGFQGTCRLEAWHQIISGPEPNLSPTSIARTEQSSDSDTQLSFGQMIIGPGNAFLVGAGGEVVSSGGEPIRVAKEYFVDPASGMRFLVESIPLASASEHLKTLPPAKGAFKIDKGVKNRMQAMRREGSKRTRPVAISENKKPGEIRITALAKATLPPRAGFVLDFGTLVTQTNQILAGYTTYVVASNSVVSLSGTTVIEPGTVVKFGQFNSGTPVINILGTIDCRTKPYAPAVFTSREDRTVGETNTAITASINTNVSYGAYHLYVVSTNNNPFSLHDIRSLYAQNSFSFSGTNAVDIWNIQASRIPGNVIESSGYTNNLRNVLAHYVGNVVVPTANNVIFKGEHFTVHTASKTFDVGIKTGCSFSLINPLLIGVANPSSSGFTTTGGATNESDVGIFQTVGSGAHYLADGSPYRNAGSTSISTNLSNGVFRYSTTHPPLIISGNFTVNTTLYPQAPRDIDTPDIGFHYPALDWAVGNISVSSGVTLTLTNGVALAGYDVNSLTLNGSSKFYSEGRPLNFNRFVRYNTVQEQPVDWGATAATMRLLNISSANTLALRFTEFDHLAYNAGSIRNNALAMSGSGVTVSFLIRDSHFYNSSVPVSQGSGTTAAINILNNLFHRATVNLLGNSEYSIDANVRNNLCRYGTFSFARMGSGTWTANNNVFDHCNAYWGYNSTDNSNNAYETGATPMTGALNNKFITTFDYEAGVQGQWYYPTSGTNLFTLVNAGSQTAASAGLFHFTTRTDHTKDTSTVDIGFHYPAIDSNGPLDTDTDGLSDYFEDIDGDGVADSNESNYAISVMITSPPRSNSLP